MVPGHLHRTVYLNVLRNVGLYLNVRRNIGPIRKGTTKRWVGYLSSSGLLSVHQSAYRSFHSTENALLKVVTDITEAIDAGDHALLGLLDLSAAFQIPTS